MNITLERVDPASAPATPGPRLDEIVFNLAASSCGGGSLTVLPEEVNLGIAYSDPGGLNEANLTIARLEGGQYVTAPKLAADPPANYVSATITQPGGYIVYQR